MPLDPDKLAAACDAVEWLGARVDAMCAARGDAAQSTIAENVLKMRQNQYDLALSQFGEKDRRTREALKSLQELKKNAAKKRPDAHGHHRPARQARAKERAAERGDAAEGPDLDEEVARQRAAHQKLSAELRKSGGSPADFKRLEQLGRSLKVPRVKGQPRYSDQLPRPAERGDAAPTAAIRRSGLSSSRGKYMVHLGGDWQGTVLGPFDTEDAAKQAKRDFLSFDGEDRRSFVKAHRRDSAEGKRGDNSIKEQKENLDKRIEKALNRLRSVQHVNGKKSEEYRFANEMYLALSKERFKLRRKELGLED